jgi:glycosyltransferase involved in cell wall biosynthesis
LSINRKALIVEENNTVPYDPRVWQEATTLRDAGWLVTVICPAAIGVHPDQRESGKTVYPEDLDGVTVYRFPLTFAEKGIIDYLAEYLSAFTAIARLSWLVWRRESFDIIHFCNPPDIFFPISIFYRLLGARVIFDHHDLFPEFVAWRYRGLPGTFLYAVARVTEFLTFRSANIVISTNESYRRIAIERGGVPAERVIVVRNGPKRDQFAPVDPLLTLKRGFPYLACYAGIMGHEDGVLELLSSIRYLVHDLDRRDILFVLLGDGSIYSQAMALVAAWELQDVLQMPGLIHDKLILRQYFCTADVLLAPEPLTPLNAHSTFIKIGEYMAMGKPIVAYDLPESRYTAQESAIYVQPGDIQGYGRAIVTLLDDPERRQRMGALGRQRFMNHLSWEDQQAELLRAYANALGDELNRY